MFRILARSFRRFNDDKCWTAAIIISYFALLSCVPLIALFFYVSARLLGTPEIALRSLNIFTDEFFARLDPAFFTRLSALSGAVTNLGLFGLLGSLVAGSFLFSNIITTLNQIFRAKFHRSFVYNRLMEYVAMFVMGVIMVLSLAMTAVWSALQASLRASALVRNSINPATVALVDSVFIQYLIPYALTFFVFFILYKYIPEVRVHTRAALPSAAAGALLYEVFKRIFAFYVAHFSAVGIVMSKLLQGTLTSILYFLLWISSSLVILLWGAELTAVLNEAIAARAERTAAGETA